MVVASGPHGKQRGIPIARAAYGIENHLAIALLCGEQESPLAVARERIGGLATRIALAEIGVPPFDADTLSKAGDRFEELATHPTLLIPAAARYYTA